MAQYLLAIDQGTTSTRAVVFDRAGRRVSVHQLEHKQIFPRPGWVEHDAVEVWHNVCTVVIRALADAGLDHGALAAVGVTNQRETAVVWDRHTGEPVCNALVWQDTRTQRIVDRLAGEHGVRRYAERTGLPLSTYFSGPKITWILDSVPGARRRAEAGDLLFGTMDSWVLWNLTGGVDGGLHVTDVTNASRTLLMDLRTLDWDSAIAADMGVPLSMLPRICPSGRVHGQGAGDGPLSGVPIAGILGDQQAATFGQACFSPGTTKNTYGTGNFMLLNTGATVVPSTHGLLTTVCYRIGDQTPTYALEGSIAVTGSLVQWVRDNLGLVSSAPQIENLARSVADNGGAYFVPAFAGLFAPHWRPDARGALVGLTRYITKGHIARAVLESTAFQTREVLDAMAADSGVETTVLKVDGGMVNNETLMQFQADILGIPVVRPAVTETTALGVAYAAGIAVGFWSGEQEVADNWMVDRRWEPQLEAAQRQRLYRTWQKAVTKALDWVDENVEI